MDLYQVHGIPNLNFQATNLRLKISSEIESFKRDGKKGPSLWGIIKVGSDIFEPDRKCQARLKVSILD